MKVSEVMTRDVQTVRARSAGAAKRQASCCSADAGSIPVTDGERLIGMITDRDIAVRGVAKGYGPDTPVRELMTDDIVCARDDDDVEDVASKMSEAQVRRLPVIDETGTAVRDRQPRRPQPRNRRRVRRARRWKA